MQSAPFLFVGEPGNFSLLSGGGQQAVQLSRRGRHRQKGVNMETIRGEAAVWSF